jgi:hypothetical protein
MRFVEGRPKTSQGRSQSALSRSVNASTADTVRSQSLSASMGSLSLQAALSSRPTTTQARSFIRPMSAQQRGRPLTPVETLIEQDSLNSTSSSLTHSIAPIVGNTMRALKSMRSHADDASVSRECVLLTAMLLADLVRLYFTQETSTSISDQQLHELMQSVGLSLVSLTSPHLLTLRS